MGMVVALVMLPAAEISELDTGPDPKKFYRSEYSEAPGANVALIGKEIDMV